MSWRRRFRNFNQPHRRRNVVLSLIDTAQMFPGWGQVWQSGVIASEDWDNQGLIVSMSGNENWQPPAQETKIWHKEVEVPCAKIGADPNQTTRFKRTMIPSMDMACTTAQAIFRQRQRDAKKVA